MRVGACILRGCIAAIGVAALTASTGAAGDLKGGTELPSPEAKQIQMLTTTGREMPAGYEKLPAPTTRATMGSNVIPISSRGGCPWDLDGNNVVNVFDLLALLDSWGPCPGCPADFNGDNVVNVFDLLPLLDNWGPCPGCIDEMEPDCGLPEDTVNGGCNSDPPVFSPIDCGDCYNSSGAFDTGLGLRDTDWYEIIVTEPTEVTWTVTAEFECLMGYIAWLPGGEGSGDCGQITGSVDPFVIGAPGDTVSVSVVVGPGTHWFFCAPTFAVAVECPTAYQAELTCAEPPRGACCFPDTSCQDDMTAPECAAAGGFYQGNDTVCAEIECPEIITADFCEDAVAISVPFSGLTDTSNATFDDVGLCGTSNTAPGVWAKVTGDGTTYTATTCTDFFEYDTKLSVFCGNCNDLICVGGNDDNCSDGASVLLSTVTWCTEAGREYFILIHGFSSGVGRANLVVESDGLPCDNPPDCAIPIGACCLPDQSCVDGVTPGECAAQDGIFQGDGTTCDQVECGLIVTADFCEDAVLLPIPSVSVTDTTGATFDDVGTCGTSNTQPGVWAKVIGTGNTITVTTCDPVFYDYDTKLSVFCGTCDVLVCVTGNDDNCPDGNGLLSTVSWCSEVGREYYILIHGFSGVGQALLSVFDDGVLCDNPPPCEFFFGACCLPDGECVETDNFTCADLFGEFQGDGTLCAETECPPGCASECPPEGILENEPVCQDEYVDETNGGCNSVPEVFQPINCGETYCGETGTYFFTGLSYRDTDWFEFMLEETTVVTWDVVGEFPTLLIFIIDLNSGGCDNPLIVSQGGPAAAPCVPTSATATLGPGRYSVWVGPNLFGTGVDCGSNWIGTLSCN
jgi:hypothetical protein